MSAFRFSFAISGKITCTFGMPVEGNFIFSSESLSLTVLGSLFATISNLNMTLMEKMPMTLTCQSHVPDTGHPDCAKGATFKWFENDIELSPDGSKYIYSTYVSPCDCIRRHVYQ